MPQLDDDDERNETSVDSQTPHKHVISGSVGDGPISGAKIAAFSAAGARLGVASSDPAAEFSLTVTTESGDYPLRLTAVGGNDLVTMSAPDFDLQSAALHEEDASVANLNPFTTVAMALAREMAGGLTVQNVEAALERVGAALDFGQQRLVGRAMMNADIDAANIAEMLRSSEALGEALRRARSALASVGRNVSGIAIVGRIGSDLADGVIDGRGGPNADPQIAAVTNLAIAQVEIETMANRLTVMGIDAGPRLHDALAQVFAGTPDPGFEALPVTQGMLDAAVRGTLAAAALMPSADIDALSAALDTLQPGMLPSQVRRSLPADVGDVLDNVLLQVAGGTSTDIELVNGIARTGSLPSGNRAPVISGTPATAVAVGVAYRFLPAASDPDGDALRFSISGKPTWAGFDTGNGELAGIPQAADAGVYQDVVITVSDGEMQASLPAFSITVDNSGTNNAPQISGSPPGTATVGNAYEFMPTATDPDGDTLSFSIANKPSWLSFDTSSGRLSGTPGDADVGIHGSIEITVSDGTLTANLPAFAITVEATPPPNQAPGISGTPATRVTVGDAYDFTPTASDPDGDALSFSIVNKPAWAAFDTGSGRLSGTPADADVGSYADIVVSVSDGTDSASLPAFTITVEPAPNETPTISGTPPAAVTVGNAYEFTPTASDPDGDALSFSIANKPAWATFDTASGRLCGTPADADVGSYADIVISVSDGTDSASLPAFTITVEAVALGSATLTWTPPTRNTDGTPLTDLAGYRIYWGTEPGVYPNSVTIENAGVTTYVIENLEPGTYDFVITALNSAGVESEFSNVAGKSIP